MNTSIVRRMLAAIVLAMASLSFNEVSAATVTVNVGANGSLMFSPSSVKIKVGDTVQWVWKSGGHSVVSGMPGAPTGQFSSGILNSGATFSRTFSSAGKVNYYCGPHGGCCQMIGTVEVETETPTPTPTPSPSATATPTPAPTPLVPNVAEGLLRIEVKAIVSGLTAPVDLVAPNDGSGRLLVIGQTGIVTLIQNGNAAGTPFLDVSNRLVTLSPDYDERGLLGFAFHPGFSNPASPGFRKLYTYTSEPVAGQADFTVPNGSAFNHQSVVAEWEVDANNPNVVNVATRREVMRINEPQSNHNGGKLACRPSDRELYIALGDGGAANDVGAGHNPAIGNGQDTSNVLGKILRIDPLNPALTSASNGAASANGKYRVPSSNPFVGKPGVDEIYAYGFRNPFRFSFDPATDKMIVGDVGQNNVEEIDVVQAGKNYGWNK
ncbi:MAG: PQQ-dependent sugar dehydrogenase, partial [Chthoniobacterales bacterium]|nr:PQQ-dependent sugar dehydrogenase [Chthoniobacterales bacterium]